MLKDLLTERREGAVNRFDEKTRNIMSNATAQLQKEKLAENAANIGQIVPNSEMLDHNGNPVMLYDCLKGKTTILNFFRGTWCPYCNLELKAYIDLLVQEKDIQLIALSPEKLDVVSEKMAVEEAPFTILCDINNSLAKKLNLVFTLPEDLQETYKGFGFSLENSQGNDGTQLPMPATYIIDKDAKIVKAWVNADYTYRAEPSEVISEYKKI